MVLERQFHELKALHEFTERQVKDLKDSEIVNSDAVGLKGELQRVNHELRDARHIEQLLREDLGTGQLSQTTYEQRLEESERLIAQILNVAIQFRDTHTKALRAAQVMVVHPGSSKSHTRANQQGANSSPPRAGSPVALFASLRHSTLVVEALHGALDELPSIDPSDPAAALEVLRTFDHDHFLEAIGKAGSTMRKWQKQGRDYRKKAKGKIRSEILVKVILRSSFLQGTPLANPWLRFMVSQLFAPSVSPQRANLRGFSFPPLIV